MDLPPPACDSNVPLTLSAFWLPILMPGGHVVAMQGAEFHWLASSDPRLAAYAASRLPAWLWTADGSRILFASNMGPAGAREFDLYLIDKQGGQPERITTAPGFDGFPMFSPDGRYLVFASNRANPQGHETNLFIARWVE